MLIQLVEILTLLFHFSVTVVQMSMVASHLNELNKKVQVGKDQEKAQSEKDSHSKNRGGKKPN